MDTSQILKSILVTIEPELKNISHQEAITKPSPDQWSKIELLGHLIDSAINNTTRFIRAQKSEDLLFDGYEQEFWVEAQNYAHADWREVANLFLALNNQIVRILETIPSDQLTKTRANHSVSGKLYARKKVHQPVTLEFLVLDYIAHVEHHMLQILEGYSPKVLPINPN